MIWAACVALVVLGALLALHMVLNFYRELREMRQTDLTLTLKNHATILSEHREAILKLQKTGTGRALGA